MDCEACPNTEIMCSEHFGMMLCDECVDKQNSATSILAESKVIDSTIVVKADLFNAATVAAVELKGAINADDSIPEEAKDIKYTEECYARFKHMQEVIFQTTAQANEIMARLDAQKSELRMWQVQVQTSASTLVAEYREKFKSLTIDIPAPVKATKTTIKSASKSPKAPKFDHMGVKAAAAKYNVPASGIQTLVYSKHMTPEAAGKHLAELMGLL
jgi:hypothetical protein